MYMLQAKEEIQQLSSMSMHTKHMQKCVLKYPKEQFLFEKFQMAETVGCAQIACKSALEYHPLCLSSCPREVEPVKSTILFVMDAHRFVVGHGKLHQLAGASGYHSLSVLLVLWLSSSSPFELFQTTTPEKIRI
jgi:hypothetical protein